jgi:hypothetical protein
MVGTPRCGVRVGGAAIPDGAARRPYQRSGHSKLGVTMHSSLCHFPSGKSPHDRTEARARSHRPPCATSHSVASWERRRASRGQDRPPRGNFRCPTSPCAAENHPTASGVRTRIRGPNRIQAKKRNCPHQHFNSAARRTAGAASGHGQRARRLRRHSGHVLLGIIRDRFGKFSDSNLDLRRILAAWKTPLQSLWTIRILTRK